MLINQSDIVRIGADTRIPVKISLANDLRMRKSNAQAEKDRLWLKEKELEKQMKEWDEKMERLYNE